MARRDQEGLVDGRGRRRVLPLLGLGYGPTLLAVALLPVAVAAAAAFPAGLLAAGAVAVAPVGATVPLAVVLVVVGRGWSPASGRRGSPPPPSYRCWRQRSRRRG